MDIDPNKVITQDDVDEPSPMELAEARTQAEMKRIEGRAKESVAQGLGDTELERKGQQMQEEAERELSEAQPEKHKE